MEDMSVEFGSPAESPIPYGSADTFESHGLETDDDEIAGVRADDVLLDRGMRYVKRPANVRFRGIIESSREEYFATDSPSTKAAVIDRLVECIGGRFLRLNKDDSGWFVITDAEVRLKIAQTLQYQQRLTCKRRNRAPKAKRSTMRTPKRSNAQPTTLSEVSPMETQGIRDVRNDDNDDSWPVPFHTSPPYHVRRGVVLQRPRLYERPLDGLASLPVPIPVPGKVDPFLMQEDNSGRSLLDMWTTNRQYWQTVAAFATQQAQSTTSASVVGEGTFGWGYSLDRLRNAATPRAMVKESTSFDLDGDMPYTVETSPTSVRATLHGTRNCYLNPVCSVEVVDNGYASLYKEPLLEHPSEACNDCSSFDCDEEATHEANEPFALGGSAFDAAAAVSTTYPLLDSTMNHGAHDSTLDSPDEPIPLGSFATGKKVTVMPF